MRNLLILLFCVFTLDAWSISVKLQAKGSIQEVAKISPIIPKVQDIINSEAFKYRVLTSTFTDTKDSSAEIYKKLTASNWELVYEFKLQRNWRGKCPVLGWTYPSTPTVWFNSCNFMGRSASGIAGTVAHEQAHKLGYSHKSARSLNSVPYAIGTIVAELYEEPSP